MKMSNLNDTRVIVVRRGVIRVMIPMTQYGLDTTVGPRGRRNGGWD